MTPDRKSLASAGVLLGLILAFMGLATILASIRRWRGAPPLFQEQERHDPPWGIAAMVGALILQIGGVDLVTRALIPVRGPGTPIRDLLLANSVASLIVASLILVMLRARPRDFGISSPGIGLNVLRGAVACAMALPLVYGVQIAVVQIWTPQSHPVQQAIVTDPTGLTALIAAIGAVIVAPIVEEVVFRGIVLGTLWKVGSRDARGSAVLANVAASIVFAGMHASQWPAPIPLFVLSFALGEVYRRSGSLVAPIVMHACFNGLSTAAMLIGAAIGNDVVACHV